MDRIIEVFNSLSDMKTAVSAAVFVVLFTIVYYLLFVFLKSNNSSKVIAIIVLLLFVGGGIYFLDDSLPKYSFVFIPLICVLFVLPVYSVEIKRAIWSKHRATHEGREKNDSLDEGEAKNCVSEIIKAVQNMSKNDIGAIIVLSNGNVPHQIIDSGVKINSDISAELIESIFFPKTPLHDGALIIDGTKIVAAGCFLPLSQKGNLPKDLGTRHRAGIGVTETIDVTTLIVSEETGIISTVKAGNITRYADTEILKKCLNNFYFQDLIEQKK